MSRVKYFAIVTALIASVVLSSCEDELDFQYHDIPPLTVVEGILTQDGGGVTITATTPMDRPLDTTPLTKASITVTDITAANDFTLLPDEEGIYRLPQGVVPVIGHSYSITVVNGNETYHATSTMLPEIESVDLKFTCVTFPGVEKATLEVSFTDPLPDEENYYWINIYRNDRTFAWSITRDIYKVDGLVRVNFFTTDKEPDDDAGFYETLEPGDIVTAKVYPVDRKMFDYLMSGAMPGKNMIDYYSGDKCLGYFLTAPVTGASIIYNPDEIFQ